MAELFMKPIPKNITKRYKVISEKNIGTFNDKINSLVAQGWNVDGNTIMTGGSTSGSSTFIYYIQRFVKNTYQSE